MRRTLWNFPRSPCYLFRFWSYLTAGRRGAQRPSPPRAAYWFRDRLVRRALEIRRAVSSGSLDNLDPQGAAYVAHIDTSAERCAAPGCAGCLDDRGAQHQRLYGRIFDRGRARGNLEIRSCPAPAIAKWTRSNGRGGFADGNRPAQRA